MFTKKSIDWVVIVVMAVILGWMMWAVMTSSSSVKVGQAPSGVVAEMATSSTVAVGPQQNKTVFAEKSFCAGRVVSTAGQSIMLSFNSGVTPANLVGHYQAASSTVAYDSGIYGCGDVVVYGPASSTITIAESR